MPELARDGESGSNEREGLRPGRMPGESALGGVGGLGVVVVDARVEHVGSLLRPPFLRDAREAYARGELTPAEFKAAEDRDGSDSPPMGEPSVN